MAAVRRFRARRKFLFLPANKVIRWSNGTAFFFFNGTDVLFPLPFFEGESPDAFAPGKLFSVCVADASWVMVAAQGFDQQHFETVHERRLLRPPEISSPGVFVRRNQYHAEIIRESWRDAGF